MVKKSYECPECGARNGYFKVDDTFRCRSCNYDGPAITIKEQSHAIPARVDEQAKTK